MALYSCVWIIIYVNIVYAIITFLVYITGILVIFTFMLVITPNFVTRFSYWWIILLLTMQFQTELMYRFKSNSEYDLTAIFKNFPIYLLMIYILLQCMVVVSNICFKPGQPLRSGCNLKKILTLEVEFSLMMISWHWMIWNCKFHYGGSPNVCDGYILPTIKILEHYILYSESEPV